MYNKTKVKITFVLTTIVIAITITVIMVLAGWSMIPGEKKRLGTKIIKLFGILWESM